MKNDRNLGGAYPDRARPDIRTPLQYNREMMMMVYAGPDVMSGNKPNTFQTYPNAQICPVCQSPNQENAKFCENCGSLLKN